MKILITGFDPFGGETINPAYEAVKKLPDVIDGAEIVKVEVPTVFGLDGQVLKEKVAAFRPDGVICVGQAGGRNGITPEKVAINLMEARIPDNKGNQPFDKKVEEDGPAAYFTSLPVKAMVKSMKDAGIPASVSYTAGTFVCNDLMYRLLHLINTEYPEMKGGFIHVPFLPQQTVNIKGGAPSMSAEDIAAGLKAAVETFIKDLKSLPLEEGETAGITH